MESAKVSSDREIYREREGDYYADSVSITAQGALCLNVGGTVICKSLAAWHLCAAGGSHVYTPDDGANGDCGLCGDTGMADAHIGISDSVVPSLGRTEPLAE